MHDELPDELRQALASSSQMLVAARAGDWPGASVLQAACDASLRKAPLNSAGLMALRQLQLDQCALLELAGRARDSVSRELSQQRTNHRAVSAYLDAADPA
ncbi:hypothetical protein [Dyella sp.]|jgi:hypothetical protein|uniref:hypothetical protein n=1 Tax=Dyella sp. TaxID=1869338 RepID=UPI002D77E89A|nr:hypothetical protein [Dyella sp.]HET6433840.1 hypothetical protein [Dyella sp.]